MPGPAPKNAATRARRNVRSTAASVPSQSTRPAGGKPSLPERVADDPWHPHVVVWWNDMWASGMSDEYHDSDVHQLYILADLLQLFWTTDPRKVRDRLLLGAEIRMQRMAFGLTPIDRRRLEWQIETVEAAQDRGTARREVKRAPKPPAAADDPRQALRVV